MVYSLIEQRVISDTRTTRILSYARKIHTLFNVLLTKHLLRLASVKNKIVLY